MTEVKLSDRGDVSRIRLKACRAEMERLRAAVDLLNARIRMIVSAVGETDHPLFKLAILGWKPGTDGCDPISLRRLSDGSFYRTSEGLYIVDHPHGPTEITAAELVIMMRLIASVQPTTGQRLYPPAPQDGEDPKDGQPQGAPT